MSSPRPGAERVRAAFDAVRRKDFLPASQRRFAQQDRALEIGYAATNSQPTTVRNMLELLDVEAGHRVLDVGSGSGWTTALLAELVGPDGEVVGVELVPELVAMGRKHLGDRFAWATVHQAEDGILGWPLGSPYDRILVSAAATRRPVELLAQLAPGGVMVVPILGVMHRLERGDRLLDEEHGRYSFVPLKGG
jgi:protein-L-isoaspartate(D-aspartate) O-methyltransferase